MCGSAGGVQIADPLDLSGHQRNKNAENAQRAADAAEAVRMAGINTNVMGINKAYAGRAPQYAQFGAALRDRYTTELKRQQDEATRQTKFSLARGGLAGGSAAIDAGRVLNREATAGTVAAEQKVRGGVADLQSRDESARLAAIDLAQAGGDIGNAATRAGESMRTNLAGADASNTVSNLGHIFGDTAAAYRAQQDAALRRNGFAAANPYAPPPTPRGP
jgi:hypothetical protein